MGGRDCECDLTTPLPTATIALLLAERWVLRQNACLYRPESPTSIIMSSHDSAYVILRRNGLLFVPSELQTRYWPIWAGVISGGNVVRNFIVSFIGGIVPLVGQESVCMKLCGSNLSLAAAVAEAQLADGFWTVVLFLGKIGFLAWNCFLIQG